MNKLFLVFLVFFLFLSMGCSRKPKTSCIYGDEIPADILDLAIQTGDELVQNLEEKEFDQLYDRGSILMKKSQTREQFKLVLEGITNHLTNLSFSQLREAYYLKSKAGKKYQVVTVPCNLGSEGVNDIYQVPSNRELIALIYSAVSDPGSVHIFIELINEEGEWRLFSLVPGLETFQGKNVEDYTKLARQAREGGKPKLALLYYKLAFLLADLSPNVFEFVSVKVAEEMAQVKADYMPTGSFQIWNLSDGSHFEVYNVDVFIGEGEPWVNIDWIVDSFDDTKKLEQSSEKLLDFAFEKFPETKEFFKGIVVTAHTRNPALASQAYRKFRKFSETSQ